MQEKKIILSQLKIGQSAYVVGITGNLKVKTSLMELGFSKGTLVRILNISSLKKSFLIEIRGFVLALRESAVNMIEVILSKES